MGSGPQVGLLHVPDHAHDPHERLIHRHRSADGRLARKRPGGERGIHERYRAAVLLAVSRLKAPPLEDRNPHGFEYAPRTARIAVLGRSSFFPMARPPADTTSTIRQEEPPRPTTSGSIPVS